VEERISSTYSGCVSIDLAIKEAKRVRRILLPTVACMPLLYFSTLFHKGTVFGKKVIEYKKRVLIFGTILSETFFILRRIRRDIVICVHSSSYEILGILVRF
jgi:hypothetical protein